MQKYFGSLEIWSKTFLPLDNSENIPKGKEPNLFFLSSDANLFLFCFVWEQILSLAGCVSLAAKWLLVWFTQWEVLAEIVFWQERRPLAPSVCLRQHPSQQLPLLHDSRFC